jgi:hypothetical protein
MFRDSESGLCVDCGGVPVEGYARPLRTQLIVASADPSGAPNQRTIRNFSFVQLLWVSFVWTPKQSGNWQLANPPACYGRGRGPRRTTAATAPLQLQVWVRRVACLLARSLNPELRAFPNRRPLTYSTTTDPRMRRRSLPPFHYSRAEDGE